MEIKTKLSGVSLRQAAKDVREYENNLKAKIREVLERLIGKGIAVAEQTIGDYGNYT